jgi:uncharacterized protein
MLKWWFGLDAAGYESCGGNLKTELSKVASFSRPPRLDISALRWLRYPRRLNLFINVPVMVLEEGKGGNLRLTAPMHPKGGCAVMRAEVECMVVMSACPMDLGPAGV